MAQETKAKPKKIRYLREGKEDLTKYTLRGTKRQRNTPRDTNKSEIRVIPKDILTYEQKVIEMSRRGSVTTYKPSYCQEMFKFFDRPYTKIIETESGVKLFPNDFPTFERFAVNIGTVIRVLQDWVKQYPEFAETYEKCKHIQKDFLISNGTKGLGNAHYTIFVTKAVTDLKEINYNDNMNTTKYQLDEVSKQILLDTLKASGKEITIECEVVNKAES